jgi:hypothetical protein
MYLSVLAVGIFASQVTKVFSDNLAFHREGLHIQQYEQHASRAVLVDIAPGVHAASVDTWIRGDYVSVSSCVNESHKT